MTHPTMDLSMVLQTPEFMDEFKVIRRIQGTNINGEPYVVSTETYTGRRLSCIGVCVPSGQNDLVRVDAYEAQNKSLQVITKFRLQGAAQEPAVGLTPQVQFLPDLVVWNNATYVVRDVEDWSRIGRGFLNASCLMIDYIPQPNVPNCDYK